MTGQEERVTLFTRALEEDHFIYLLFVAPESEYLTVGSVLNGR